MSTHLVGLFSSGHHVAGIDAHGAGLASQESSKGVGYAIELGHCVAVIDYIQPVAVTVIGSLRPLVFRHFHRLGAAAALDLHVADRAIGTEYLQIETGLQVRIGDVFDEL